MTSCNPAVTKYGTNSTRPAIAALTVSTNAVTIVGALAAIDWINAVKPSTTARKASGAIAANSLIAVTNAKKPTPAINTEVAARIEDIPKVINVSDNIRRPGATAWARAPAANKIAKLPARANIATPTATKFSVDNNIIGRAIAIRPAANSINWPAAPKLPYFSSK